MRCRPQADAQAATAFPALCDGGNTRGKLLRDAASAEAFEQELLHGQTRRALVGSELVADLAVPARRLIETDDIDNEYVVGTKSVLMPCCKRRRAAQCATSCVC